MPKSQRIRIGTQAYSFDDWVGPFYPDGTPPRDYLSEYAARLPVVEVDMTFYRIPDRDMVRGWAERTPAEFRFALKTPRVVTHEKQLADCDQEMEAFLRVLAPLGEKLKCVLLQFGYFSRQAFASAKPFFDRLDAFLGTFAPRVPLACEIRNKTWLSAHYYALLRRHNVSAALVEHAWLPTINRLVADFEVVTGPLSYVRLIGDRKGIEEMTTSWDKVVVDRSAELDRVAEALRKIASRAELLVFINNHYAGHAPQTCRELRARLGAE